MRRNQPREELLVDAERHDRAHGDHHPTAYSGHQGQPPVDAADDVGRRANGDGRQQKRHGKPRRVGGQEQRGAIDTPCPAAMVRIAPRIGPTHGDHPAANVTPTKKDDVT